ncbi:hypothetical protein MKZ19_18280 [Shouchella clausii]|jgi:hypothetical protein|uniref:hypothetical protein n=1 Tax=Shouchella clausii TaxID=79880 RepID=UPI0031FC14A3
MTRIKKMIQYWLRANLFLFFLVLLICLNYRDWVDTGPYALILFVLLSEFLILILALVSALTFRTPPPRKRISLADWPIGLLVLAMFYVLTQYAVTKGGNLPPNPSFLITFLLLINSVIALFSLLFPTAIVYIHDGNVHAQEKTFSNSVFKYLALFMNGVNAEAQRTLLRLPFVFHRLLAVIVFVFMFLIAVTIGSIFE